MTLSEQFTTYLAVITVPAQMTQALDPQCHQIQSSMIPRPDRIDAPQGLLDILDAHAKD